MSSLARLVSEGPTYVFYATASGLLTPNLCGFLLVL